MVHSYYKNDFENKIKRDIKAWLLLVVLFLSFAPCSWVRQPCTRRTQPARQLVFLHLCCCVSTGCPRSEAVVTMNWVMPFHSLGSGTTGVKSRSLVINSLVLGTRGLLVVICLAQTVPPGTWNYWHELGQVLRWTRQNCHIWPFFS